MRQATSKKSFLTTQNQKQKGKKNIMLNMVRKFRLGRVVGTPRCLQAVAEHEILLALRWHISGNWGEISEEDKESNEQALKDGGRLLSAYRAASGVRFWIITEADRSVTTLLLPEDY
jgi:hypothetical protein